MHHPLAWDEKREHRSPRAEPTPGGDGDLGANAAVIVVTRANAGLGECRVTESERSVTTFGISRAFEGPETMKVIDND